MAVFKKHIGDFLDTTAIAELLDSWGPWEVKSYKASGKLPACQYYTCKQRGIQLCFEQKALETPRVRDAESSQGSTSDWIFAAAHLYNKNVDGFHRFDGELVFGLNFEMKNAEVATEPVVN